MGHLGIMQKGLQICGAKNTNKIRYMSWCDKAITQPNGAA
jgi:hypothetical protein